MLSALQLVYPGDVHYGSQGRNWAEGAGRLLSHANDSSTSNCPARKAAGSPNPGAVTLRALRLPRGGSKERVIHVKHPRPHPSYQKFTVHNLQIIKLFFPSGRHPEGIHVLNTSTQVWNVNTGHKALTHWPKLLQHLSCCASLLLVQHRHHRVSRVGHNGTENTSYRGRNKPQQSIFKCIFTPAL